MTDDDGPICMTLDSDEDLIVMHALVAMREKRRKAIEARAKLLQWRRGAKGVRKP